MVDTKQQPSSPAKALSVFDFTREGLAAKLAEWNEPAYRADQVLRWVYREGATSWDAMSNLPKSLRDRLAAALRIFQSEISQRQESSDETIKLLLRWPDSATSECVLIPEAARNTACISTQVGCPVGCVFCASGLAGLQRNLTAGQIVEQAMRVRQLVGGEDRLSNIVFMGLGEPLANYEATVQAIRTINADWGMNIGARKITVSTVGLPKQMKRLADENLQITLALSLHAPNDELRRKLIPWAERISMESLIEAARYYFDQTGREVTLEYILLGGVNDLLEHALELGKVSRKMRSNVNLIPYNPVEGLPYERPSKERVHQFVLKLRERGINAHVRKSRGLDIDGACGQLRRREAATSLSRS